MGRRKDSEIGQEHGRRKQETELDERKPKSFFWKLGTYGPFSLFFSLPPAHKMHLNAKEQALFRC